MKNKDIINPEKPALPAPTDDESRSSTSDSDPAPPSMSHEPGAASTERANGTAGAHELE
ncbi:hypothetical protein H0H81_005291, partial [Sphagnurus paluster]